MSDLVLKIFLEKQLTVNNNLLSTLKVCQNPPMISHDKCEKCPSMKHFSFFSCSQKSSDMPASMYPSPPPNNA